MEHRTFLQSLTSQQRQVLTRRNNHSVLIRLLVLMVCLSVCSLAIVSGLFLFPLLMVVQGMLLVSLFHLMHECVHDTVFIQRLPNRVIAHVCGFILFLPAIWFRFFHLAHHRFTQQEGKDPELDAAKPASIFQWLVHVSGATIWQAQFKLLFRALAKPCHDSYIKEDKQSQARLEMLLMLAGYALLLVISVVTGSAVLLYLWVIPLILGQPFLRLYLLAEHTGCERGSNMLRNTRTVLTNPVVRWFTWNMPYHTEHHVYPTVPFHQLPRLHELMRAHLVEVESGYVEFNKRYAQQLARAANA